MCAVSFVGDHWNKKVGDDPFWQPANPWIKPTTFPSPGTDLPGTYPTIQPYVTREELDAFRKEMGDRYDEMKRSIEDMRELLLSAKEYDEATGQPDCEMEEKVAVLKRMAQLFGVDLSDVFGGTK